MQQRSVSGICDTEYIPLPRSLTRCARSFGCGERYRLTGGAEIPWKMPGRNLTGKREGHGEAVFP